MKTSNQETTTAKIEEFLELFGKDIIISRPHSTKVNSPMKHHITIAEAIESNQNGYDVYFIPNQGGTKNAEINRFNSLFIDLDAGRDPETKEYLCDAAVAVIKQQFQDTIINFKYSPSIVTETRNGYHCYWLLNNTDAILSQDWKVAENLIVNHFNADKMVTKEANLLRLPYLLWSKPWTGIAPFEVTINTRNNTSYDLVEISSYLKTVSNVGISASVGVETKSCLKATNKEKASFLLSAPKHLIGKSAIRQAISMADAPFIAAQLSIDNKEPLWFDTIYQANDWLKANVPMREFLDLPEGKNIPCIFHDEKKPSATVLTPEQSEHGIYFYVCLSSNCDFDSGSIIDCVANLQNISTPDRDAYRNAYRFLYNVYNIKIHDSEWHHIQADMIEYNKYMIYSGDFAAKFPDTYSLINRHQRKHLLQYMLDMAKHNICGADKTDKQGQSLFFVSQRWIATYFGKKSHKSIGERLMLLAALGLLNKVPDSDVPQEWRCKAEEIQKSKRYKHTIQFYSIPNYTDASTASTIKQNTLYWKEKGMTTKGLSYDCFSLSYDKETADRICPKSAGKDLSGSSENFILKMKSIIPSLISANGYTTEKQMLQAFKGYKSINERRSKKFLHSVLEDLKLERVRCTKAVKKRHKIKENISGNAFVIVRKKYSRKNK